MFENESIWHLVHDWSNSPPTGETSSSNPLLMPDMAHTLGVGFDIDWHINRESARACTVWQLHPLCAHFVLLQVS